MIEHLTIRNFQAIRSRRIDFDPHVTTLVGMSDSGKTSILRSLYWLTLNDPAGTAFMSWGEENTRVALGVDGHEIVRKVGKAGNIYLLDGEEYRAFGTGKVPDDISRIVNVDTGNFQMQEDSRFWLSETPGLVARELNQIVNLEVIDNALEKAGRTIRQTIAVVEITEGRIAKAQKAAEDLAWTGIANTELAKVEESVLLCDTIASRIASVAAFIEKAIWLGRRIEDAQARLRSLGKANTLLDAALTVSAKAESLETLIESIEKVQKLADRRQIIHEISEAVDHIIGWISSRNALMHLCGKIKQAQESAKTAAKDATIAAKKLAESLDGQCPICGNDYKEG